MTSYCFVLDADDKPLSPTKEAKGWYMVRKGKAKLVLKYPMTIRLNRAIQEEEIIPPEFREMYKVFCDTLGIKQV